MFVEQSAIAKQDDSPRSHCRGGCDQKHDDNLVFDRLERFDSGQQLACHHSRQADESDHHHRVDHRRHARSQGTLNHGLGRFIGRCAQRKLGFDAFLLRRKRVGQCG